MLKFQIFLASNLPPRLYSADQVQGPKCGIHKACANQSNEDGFSQGHLSLTNARPWKKASSANDQRPDWLPRQERKKPSAGGGASPRHLWEGDAPSTYLG